jgi:hypothetical protein
MAEVLNKEMKWFGYLVFALLILTAYVSKEKEPVYQTGTLTKGNPDNSYLDSCEVYCCGD